MKRARRAPSNEGIQYRAQNEYKAVNGGRLLQDGRKQVVMVVCMWLLWCCLCVQQMEFFFFFVSGLEEAGVVLN